MHTWRISFGVTLSLMAILAFYAMARLDFLAPHGRFIVAEYWLPITFYTFLAAATFMVALTAVLRRLGLHDVGRKVDPGRTLSPPWRGRSGLDAPPCRSRAGRVRRVNPTTPNRRTHPMTPKTTAAQPQAPPSRFRAASIRLATFSVLFLAPAMLMAQRSPWTRAVQQLQAAFTGPIARGLSLVALVVGGLMFAFGEGGSKKLLAGIIFGLGMTMGAANFLGWLF